MIFPEAHQALVDAARAAKPSTDWTVAFTDAEGRSPTTSFLLRWMFPKGYRHCLAFREQPCCPNCGTTGVLLVQLRAPSLQVSFFPGETLAQRMELEATEHGATFATMPEAPEDRWRPRLLTCVALLRAIGGIGWRIHTPRGLARYLRTPKIPSRS